jgi:hypothetical protein
MHDQQSSTSPTQLQVSAGRIIMSRFSLLSPPNPNPLRSWPISRILGAAPPVFQRTIVPALRVAKAIPSYLLDVRVVRKALHWHVKWHLASRPFGRVVDPLELVVDDIAVTMRIELLVATEALQEQVSAHVGSSQINPRPILPGLVFVGHLSWLLSLLDEDVKIFVGATTRSMR